MNSFIFNLTRALARAMGADLRASTTDRILGRGEFMALATVLEILGSDTPSGSEHDADTWSALELAARRDLEIVQRARPSKG